MTRLGDKVQVEPLEASRVARIEQHVLADLRATEFQPLRSRWSLGRLAMPVVAVAAVCAVAWLGARALRPEVERVAVPTETMRAERVTTAAGSSRLDLGEATIEVAPNTSFELRRTGEAILIVLDHGRVECKVEPRGARPPFVVRAADVDVVVVGTLFSVERDHEVRVHVTRGQVRVESAGEPTMVAAGQRWSADEGVRVAARVDTDPSSTVALDPRTPAAPPAAPKRPRTRTDSGVRPAAPRPATEPARLAEGAAREPRLAAPMTATSSDARKATVEFLDLALQQSTPSKTAAWALYSKAHVEYFRLRKVEAALATLDIFERRFNAGAYTEDALELRITITCSTNRKHECRGAAHKYLGQFPDGDYREEARAITNWDVR
jgi:hypothetical protein